GNSASNSSQQQTYSGHELIDSATFIITRWVNERGRLLLPPEPRRLPFVRRILVCHHSCMLREARILWQYRRSFLGISFRRWARNRQ
ncbi:cytochrome p450, partial [Moniliophthora roreri]